MPTAVLAVDVTRLPDEITGLDEFQGALVLYRLRDRPIAQHWHTVTTGRLARRQLLAPLLEHPTPLARGLTIASHPAVESPPSSPPSATVAICTRDRPDDLRSCLISLQRLTSPANEILVIDNCPSSAATRQLIDEFPGVRYVLEPRAGLDRARNRALREATSEIVAFTDDDTIVDPGWLAALQRNFDVASVMCVTGLTMPMVLDTVAQECFERYSPFGRGFMRREFDLLHHDPLHVSRVGAGANMAVRRTLLEQVAPFNEALDAGTPSQSGGDHEMFTRILASGYRIVYDPAALSWHRHRASWPALRHVLYGYGVGVYAMWTSLLLNQQEWGVLPLAWGWLRTTQLPQLARALLRRPHSYPLDLLTAELRGCLAGPAAYHKANRLRQG